MPNDRVSLRVPFSLVEAIDVAAKREDRSRTNWIVKTLGDVSPLPFKAIKALQQSVPDAREKMLSFRLPERAVSKFDKAATQESRTRSEVYARLLAAATMPGWPAALAAARGDAETPAPAAADSVFA